jgi:hypothetical protein
LSPFLPKFENARGNIYLALLKALRLSDPNIELLTLPDFEDYLSVFIPD